MSRLEKIGFIDHFNLLQASFGAMPDAPTSERDYVALYDAFIAQQEQNHYDYIHAVRFRETAKAFGPYLEKAKRVLELGGHGRIGRFSREAFGCSYCAYEGELREPYNIADASHDAVLCLEVIEHMKDRPSLETDPEHDVGCWNYSGAMNLLSESYRVLQPGGVLLVTTPNATSVDVLKCVLAGDHPYMFGPHVRELAPRQVKAFAEHVGFKLMAFGTFFAWGVCDSELREKLLKIIADLGFDPQHRGDDAYYVFQRQAI